MEALVRKVDQMEDSPIETSKGRSMKTLREETI